MCWILWQVVVNEKICSLISKFHIIPNRGAVREGNGLENHNLETELILPVFKAKLYYY